MKTTLYVYLGIFILLFIPLACIFISNLVGKKHAKALRLRNSILSGAAIVALGALCLSLYFVTINRQPMLVIDRVVNGIVADQESELVSKRLLTSACLEKDVPHIKAALTASQYAIGDKTLTSGNNSVFVVRPDQAEDTVILMEVYQTDAQSTVVAINLKTGEEAAELISKDTFQPFN